MSYKLKKQEIYCGSLDACFLYKADDFEGQTCSGEKTTANGFVYKITLGTESYLEVAVMTWMNGEQDVRVIKAVNVPESLERLKHGLRIGIHKSGRLRWIELAQARMKSANWSTAYRASKSELDQGANLKVVRLLKKAGAVEIGTKEKVLGNSGRKRFYLCSTFKNNSNSVPIVAYVLTRILPIMNQYPSVSI